MHRNFSVTDEQTIIFAMLLLLGRAIDYPCDVVGQLDEIVGMRALHLHFLDALDAIGVHHPPDILHQIDRKLLIAARIENDRCILQLLLRTLEYQTTNIVIERCTRRKLLRQLRLEFLVDDHTVVKEVVRSDGPDERFAHMIRIVLEMELAEPVEFVMQKLDTLIAGGGVFPIFKYHLGNREKPTRSLVELEARVAGFVDEDEHSSAA